MATKKEHAQKKRKSSSAPHAKQQERARYVPKEDLSTGNAGVYNASLLDHCTRLCFVSSPCRAVAAPLTRPLSMHLSDGPAGDSGLPASSGPSLQKLEKSKLKKQKREKNSTLIQEITGHWEVLRQTNTAKDKKVEMVGKILDACGDRLGDVAASHTASRIIQSCVKYGNVAQRKQVQDAVLGSARGVVELSKNPYSRFVVSKLIMTAGKEQLGGTYRRFLESLCVCSFIMPCQGFPCRSSMSAGQ